MHRRVATVAGAVVVLAAAALVYAQGALSGLGVTETAAKGQVVDAFASGYVNVYQASKAVKAAAPTVRATMVTTLIGWAKAYTETPAFKADYERQRAADRPQPPKFKGTVEEEMAAQRAERRKGLDEAKKNVAQMPANMRPQLEAQIKQTEAQYREDGQRPAADRHDAAGNRSAACQRAEGVRGTRGGAREALPRRPAGADRAAAAGVPGPQPGRRLRGQAGAGGQPDEVRQPEVRGAAPEWKLCYRAGKEATAAARTSAQAWLATLK